MFKKISSQFFDLNIENPLGGGTGEGLFNPSKTNFNRLDKRFN
jgi:hypothetical protein